MSAHNAEILRRVLNGARRHIDILSPDLAPELLNEPFVSEELSRLARRGNQTRIRVLAAGFQPNSAMSRSRLIALARRLTSSLAFKVLPNHPEWHGETAVIADRHDGFLWLSEGQKSHEFSSRAEAATWSETFDRLWVAAEMSPELRRL